MNGLSFPIAILGYNVTHAKAPVELGYEPDIWHAGPVGGFLLAVLILVTAGEIGRNASRLLNFPEALGELMMGIILGNIYFFSGWGFFELLHTTPNIAVPADFGAIILLLSVGLRTDIHELFHTGPSPLLVFNWRYRRYGRVGVPGGSLLAFRCVLEYPYIFDHYNLRYEYRGYSKGI